MRPDVRAAYLVQRTAGNRALRRVLAAPRQAAQRYELKVFEKQQAATLISQRATEWPDGADAMVAWAKSWKQFVAILNSYTHDEWEEIAQLFPDGIDQVKKAAIDEKVNAEKIRIDLLTPLSGRVLKASALARRILLIRGEDLTNQTTIGILTAIDPDMTHWGKYTTPMYDGGTDDRDDDYQVHFYYNTSTKQVCTTRDYKKVYRDNTQEFI